MKTILVDAINTLIKKNEGINIEIYNLLETYPNKKIILTNANINILINEAPRRPASIETGNSSIGEKKELRFHFRNGN